MKMAIILVLFLVALDTAAQAQGVFDFNNNFARTRIGSIDGPLAGSGIWAQMLVGPTADNLAPVGVAVEHGSPAIGLVDGGIVAVPGMPPCTFAYLEMVAWDGQLWGTSLSARPCVGLWPWVSTLSECAWGAARVVWFLGPRNESRQRGSELLLGQSALRSGCQWFKLQISADGQSLSLADSGRVYDGSTS